MSILDNVMENSVEGLDGVDLVCFAKDLGIDCHPERWLDDDYPDNMDKLAVQVVDLLCEIVRVHCEDN